MSCHMVKRVFLAVLIAVSPFCCGQAGERTREPIEVAVSAERAAQIAMSQAGEGEIVQQKLRSKKRGAASYEILIASEENRTSVVIDANTGEVLKSETKPISHTPRQRRGNAEDEQTKISHEQANEIAMETIGGTVIESRKVSRERSGVVYEVMVLKDGKKGVVIVDANTGEVMRAGEQYKGHHGKKKIRRWRGDGGDEEEDAPQAVKPPKGGDSGKDDERGDDDDNGGDEDGGADTDGGDDSDGNGDIG